MWQAQETRGFQRKDLNSKKPAIEVEIDGHTFVLDFFYMFLPELETGVMHPIGWIDEADCCFLPEAFTGVDEACQCYHGTMNLN
ncbi:hypothetical protein V6N13_139981 [Hibiscus sabdariffa]|uniref:RCD1 WWE domain-containing protein n=1 Tax=Hibiscus sabdariffa TaxID=183260 RepID=A0ABR2QBI3_9ROSI